MENAISKCRLFAGMTEEQTARALAFFRASRRSFRKGEFILEPGGRLTRFGLVLSGGVQVCMDDIDGNRMIMANVEPGGTFGEALAFLGREAPIYIFASSDAELVWLDASGISSCGDAELVSRFVALFAERTLQMNDRIQLLSKLTLRSKLKTLFTQQAAASGSETFTLPFSRGDMAAYLGSDRSALSRELSKMKAEGIIDYRGRVFTIKKQ